MIGALTGKIVDRNPSGEVIVDVNGVGYQVSVTGTTLSRLGDSNHAGTAVTLRIHTRVREDAITLYGFTTADEKRCFDVLVGTHGVGPAVAMAVLTFYSPLEIRQVVTAEDAESLARVPGIGKKTAARMIVELKNRFDLDLDSGDSPTPIVLDATARTKHDEVSAGLAALGYGSDEVRHALTNLPNDDSLDASDLLRAALRGLAQKARK